MILSTSPLYNTIIVFVAIIFILYITKPNIIYDKVKGEFRQFGIEDGKCLMPIYVISALLAIILYILFNYLAKKDTTVNTNTNDISLLKHQLEVMNQINQFQLNQFQLN